MATLAGWQTGVSQQPNQELWLDAESPWCKLWYVHLASYAQTGFLKLSSAAAAAGGLLSKFGEPDAQPNQPAAVDAHAIYVRGERRI
jgi:hypothetical protein